MRLPFHCEGGFGVGFVCFVCFVCFVLQVLHQKEGLHFKFEDEAYGKALCFEEVQAPEEGEVWSFKLWEDLSS